MVTQAGNEWVKRWMGPWKNIYTIRQSLSIPSVPDSSPRASCNSFHFILTAILWGSYSETGLGKDLSGSPSHASESLITEKCV